MHERTYSRITKKTPVWRPEQVQASDLPLAISKLKNTKSKGRDQINLQHINEGCMVTIR